MRVAGRLWDELRGGGGGRSPEPAWAAGGTGTLPRLLFVAGMLRSGTTLVAKALAGHPDVFAAGELANLWHWARINGRCSCGAPVRDCAVWGRVIAEVLAGTGRPVEVLDELQRGARRLLGRPAAGYPEVLRLTLAAITRATGKAVVVDTSKNLRAIAAYDDLDVAFLHLVRDPRGVAMSEAHHTVWPGVSEQDRPPVRSVARSAVTWDVFNLVCERSLRRVDPGRQLRLRYEELVDRPAGVLDEVAALTGLRPHEWRRQADRLWLPEGHLMCGNPMRYTAGWTPVRDRQNWRRGLTPGEQRTVERLTGPLRARYGYPD